MNKNRLLWVLVAVDVLLAFTSVGVEGFFGWTLPPTLAAYNQARFSSFSISSPGDVLQLLVLGVGVLFAFTAWIGLVTFWRPARQLYLVSWAIWLLITLTSGPLVVTPVAAMLRDMNAVVGGVILGLVYFSDLARRFEPAPVERTAVDLRHVEASATNA